MQRRQRTHNISDAAEGKIVKGRMQMEKLLLEYYDSRYFCSNVKKVVQQVQEAQVQVSFSPSMKYGGTACY